jgi:hypothetical protein
MAMMSPTLGLGVVRLEKVQDQLGPCRLSVNTKCFHYRDYSHKIDIGGQEGSAAYSLLTSMV